SERPLRIEYAGRIVSGSGGGWNPLRRSVVGPRRAALHDDAATRGGNDIKTQHASCSLWLEVFGLQTCLLGDMREKARANFIAVMEGECIVGPTGPFQPSVLAALPSNGPTDSQQTIPKAAWL